MKHLPLLALLFVFFFTGVNAQNKKNTTKKVNKNYPESFTVNKQLYDKIFSAKVNDVLINTDNKYLDKAQVMLHTNNGDMQFIRLRMAYFPKSNLLIQVNGEYSTKIFLMSDDKSISYKGHIEKDVLTLTKCTRDEIVSE